MPSGKFLIVFYGSEPVIENRKSIKHIAVRPGGLALKPLIAPKSPDSRATIESEALIISPYTNLHRRGPAQITVAWQLQGFSGPRCPSSFSFSICLAMQYSMPCERLAKILRRTFSSSHSSMSGGRVIVICERLRSIVSCMASSVNLYFRNVSPYIVGKAPARAATNMRAFHHHSPQTRTSEPAFTLLSSPKTEEASSGMGQETKKERVRVCNSERSKALGMRKIAEGMGEKVRVSQMFILPPRSSRLGSV